MEPSVGYITMYRTPRHAYPHWENRFFGSRPFIRKKSPEKL